MALKRKAVIVIATLAGLGMLFSAFFVGLWLVLPSYIESTVLPEVSKKTGVDISGEVRRIGLGGADIAGLSIGDQQAPGLTIDSVRVDYSPVGLIRKRLKEIVVSGVTVNLVWRDGRMTIPGIGFGDTTAERGKEDIAPSRQDLSGILQLGKVVIKHGVIVAERKGLSFRVPFELEVGSARDEEKTVFVNIDIHPRGQLLSLTGKADLAQNNITLAVAGKSLRLQSFGDLVSLLPGLTMKGIAGFEGNADFTITPFSLTSLSAAIDLHEADIRYNDIHLKKNHSDTQEDKNLRIQVSRESGDTFRAKSSPLAVAFQDIVLSATDLDTLITSSEKVASGSGTVTFGVVGPPLLSPAGLLKETDREYVTLKTQFGAKVDRAGVWDFAISHIPADAPAHKAYSVPFTNGQVSYGAPQFNITGQGKGRHGTLQYEVQVLSISATAPNARISIPEVSVIGDVRLPERDSAGITAGFMVQTAETEIAIAESRGRIPLLSLTGTVKNDSKQGITFDGVTKFIDASMSNLRAGAKIVGLQGVLPITWPLAGQGEEGRLSAEKMLWHGTDLGRLKATLKQDGLGVYFQGLHDNQIFSGLTLDFEGMARVSADNGNEIVSAVTFAVPQYKTPRAVDLGRLSPTAKGLQVEGELQLQGNFKYDHEGTQSALEVSLANTTIKEGESGAALEGVDLKVYFPDLFALRSAPQQRLTFRKASVGELYTGEGEIDFQIESPNSVLIEKSGVRWCDGHVYTQAMRFSPSKKDYELTLYCDRLSFAQLLAQFGAVKAEGKGRVNGRIPVSIRNGKITFHDGFLYSTPGEGGVIRMPDTRKLTAGVPKDSPQYTQLDLASEALKDFVYEWAKVDLNTEGEDLILHMRLDGKPEKPLPFEYRQETGSFVRIGKDGQGSVFQGIRLDVNFRLPLNKILYYGSSIKKLLE